MNESAEVSGAQAVKPQPWFACSQQRRSRTGEWSLTLSDCATCARERHSLAQSTEAHRSQPESALDWRGRLDGGRTGAVEGSVRQGRTRHGGFKNSAGEKGAIIGSIGGSDTTTTEGETATAAVACCSADEQASVKAGRGENRSPGRTVGEPRDEGLSRCLCGRVWCAAVLCLSY